MANIILPDSHVNVMITYIGKVRIPDKYYDTWEERKVTRRAFYTNSNGYYNRKNEWVSTPNGYYLVPQYWKEYTWSDGLVTLAPDTLYHHGFVLPGEVIKWEYDYGHGTDWEPNHPFEGYIASVWEAIEASTKTLEL